MDDTNLAPPLPAWFTAYRPHQLAAVSEIVRAYQSGAQVVVVEAPTGSGKTLIAETVRRQLDAARTIYTTPLKHLQRQFARDYDYAKVLMGKSNYPTLQDGLYAAPLWVSAADCDAKKVEGTDQTACSYCGVDVTSCPYKVARDDALDAPLAILNTAYLLTECNLGRGNFAGADLVVVDEADVMEAELMRFIGLELSANQVKRYGLGEPAQVTKPAAWVTWCDDALRTLAGYKVRQGDPVRRAREIRRVKEHREKINAVKAGIAGGDWIYTGKGGAVAFKPVRVTEYGEDVLWSHGARWLLMSATIVSAKTLVEDELGFTGHWEYVQVESTFPVENRPVVIRANVAMNRKGRQAGADEKMCEEVARILDAHPIERVFVHAVSYNLSNVIAESIVGRNVYTYDNARDKDDALVKYLEDPCGVLVASSMDRGVDLPDDACRVTVVAKMPYRSLGDRQVNARLYAKGGKTWYAVDTVRSLIQMLGRGVRHENDVCVSYVLDGDFKRLWGENRNLFPTYVRDAMVWE